ncbi:MAG: [protein-PII] uridylyltransferase [Planctomycetota bacterium]|nr:MAG: [protein-PII] uridylyltransferase [Planctomycetota bacterium]
MNFSTEEVSRYRQRLIEIRASGYQLFQAGAPGIQTATFLCQSMEGLVLDIWNDILRDTSPDVVDRLLKHGAIVAIGGTGRGELCPYSDVDLLFLDGGQASAAFREAQDRMTRTCWDAKLEPGASCRTVPQCVEDAKNDPKFASSLVEARLLWGSRPLFENLIRAFRKQVVQRRQRQFIEECIKGRESEWVNGRAVQELEPDIKTASGGLRDLHLIRWIGFAAHGVADIDSLRLKGALDKEDVLVLKQAWEYLTSLRINLHYANEQADEKYSRGEQLRIAQERGYHDTASQRGVERLMQEYFRHTTQVASITRRFIGRNRQHPMLSQVKNYLVGHRAEGVLHVGETVDCSHRGMASVTKDLDSILKVYRLCASSGLLPSQRLEESMQRAIAKLPKAPITPAGAGYFMDILKYGQALPEILRSMAETHVLDAVLPEYTRIRSLMQFNPYHHFTVDEHTLRAVGIVTNFPPDSGRLVQQVYQEMQNKNLLHLTVILHDIGKGFVEDHCLVGERIAVDVGQRLFLPESQIETLKFLVRWHLEMADIAFRRDHTDEAEIVRFAQLCETPERLQMLYALTVADVTAVGPGTWSTWKAQQIGEFYDRCFVVLSGRHYGEYEEARLRKITASVGGILQESNPEIPQDWIAAQLSGLPAYYFTCTEAERVAADLRILHRLSSEEVVVDSTYEPHTDSVEYRIFTRNPEAAKGCFHRLAGVLTALRMSILSAEINTTHEGAVIDSFHVRDRDFKDEPPAYRRDSVARAMQEALLRRTTIEELFRKNRRFGSSRTLPFGSESRSRVRIDSSSYDSRTIVEIFADDRPGLLYSISRAINRLNLSVELAKIATHLDQVLDVFYVHEQDGSHVTGDERLNEIRSTLEARMEEFESKDWRTFS